MHHPHGFIEGDKIYRNAFLDFPERQIGEVRESEPSTINYFEERYNHLVGKIEALENAIETAENKGSYLMKLVHMRKHLSEVDALGNFEVLHERLLRLENYLKEIVAENRKKNLEIKQALLEEARPYEHSTDWKAATEQLNDIKERWIKTGNVVEELQEDIENQFRNILDTFFTRRKEFFAEKKRIANDRINHYQRLIQQARGLRYQEDKEFVSREVKRIHEEWRTVGKIQAFKQKKLWKELKYIINGLSNPRRPRRRVNEGYGNDRGGYRPQPQDDSQRYHLINDARKLAEEVPPDTPDRVKQLKMQWKNLGRMPRHIARDMNNAFNNACDLANEKHFLDKIVQSRNENYDSNTPSEQIQMKLEVLQNLITRDERGLVNVKEEVNNNQHNLDEQASKDLQFKLKLHQRKVAVKRQLQKELENELSN